MKNMKSDSRKQKKIVQYFMMRIKEMEQECDEGKSLHYHHKQVL